MNFECVSCELQVRPNDLDSMGHVNNATVLEYLETARWSWLQYHDLQSSIKIIPVVVKIEVNYKKEILMGNVIVKTSIDEKKKPFRYQVMFSQSIETVNNGTLLTAVEAKIKVGFVHTEEKTLKTVEEFLKDNKRSWQLN